MQDQEQDWFSINTWNWFPLCASEKGNVQAVEVKSIIDGPPNRSWKKVNFTIVVE